MTSLSDSKDERRRGQQRAVLLKEEDDLGNFRALLGNWMGDWVGGGGASNHGQLFRESFRLGMQTNGLLA